jgi:hypothetical protein
LRNPLPIRTKLALQNTVTVLLLRLAQVLTGLADRCSGLVDRLYGVEAEEVEFTDDDIYFLLKQSDGQYVFHGIVARDRETARKQAWKIPGSLMILDSLPEFRLKLLSEAHRREEYEQAQRSRQEGAANGGTTP